MLKFCSQCGNPIRQGEKYCNKCGNYVENYYQNQAENTGNQIVTTEVPQNSGMTPRIMENFITTYPSQGQRSTQGVKQVSNWKPVFIGIGVAIVFLVLLCPIVMKIGDNNYYFSGDSYGNSNQKSTDSTKTEKKSKYQTAIIYDHQYEGITINNKEDAYQLISKDSVSQKGQCPDEMKKIEDEIIKKYGITAVNLCEMDPAFARELGNVFQKIYSEYPSVRGHMTNVSLSNVSMIGEYIAAFMPAFQFATSSASSGFPGVFKTQILLNSSYFLNQEKLNSSVNQGSKSGHFPPNTTIYSPVAHELGHYLSFLAMIKSYQVNSVLMIYENNFKEFKEICEDFDDGTYSLSIIKEAYNRYQKDTNQSPGFDNWRGTISKYALSKDNDGNYIYDETIAEAFHDSYLNGTNASIASKYVVAVLKEKLGS